MDVVFEKMGMEHLSATPQEDWGNRTEFVTGKSYYWNKSEVQKQWQCDFFNFFIRVLVQYDSMTDIIFCEPSS